jgi:hypothetical protein
MLSSLSERSESKDLRLFFLTEPDPIQLSRPERFSKGTCVFAIYAQILLPFNVESNFRLTTPHPGTLD